MRRTAELFDELGVDYALGGSWASSILGEPRATNDVDFAVRLDRASLERLLEAAADEFYVPRAAAIDAVSVERPFRSFNLVDQLGKGKVDIYVLGDTPLDRRQLERRLSVSLSGGGRVWVTAPADIVLRKLLWLGLNDGTSAQQWRDVVGVLAANLDSIDLDDLRSTAAELGLDELLEDALAQAVD